MVAWITVACGGDDTSATGASQGSSSGSGTSADSSSGAPSSSSGDSGEGTTGSSESSSGDDGGSSGDSTGGTPSGTPAERLFAVIDGRFSLAVDDARCAAFDCVGDGLWELLGEGFEPASYGLEVLLPGTRFKELVVTWNATEADGPLGIGGGHAYWMYRRAQTDDLVLVPETMTPVHVGEPDPNFEPLLRHDALDGGDAWVFPTLTLRFDDGGGIAGVDDPTFAPRLWFDEAVRLGDPTEFFFADPWDELFWTDDPAVWTALLQQVASEKPYIVEVCVDRADRFWLEPAWQGLSKRDPLAREAAVSILLDLGNPSLSVCPPRLMALDMLADHLGSETDPEIGLQLVDGLHAMFASEQLWFLSCEIDAALTACAEDDRAPALASACAEVRALPQLASMDALPCVETETGAPDVGDGQHYGCTISCQAQRACAQIEDLDACIDACVAGLSPTHTPCLDAQLSAIDCHAMIPCDEIDSSTECDTLDDTVAQLCP
ncbi:MAG: hypothetical protein K1X88_23240 [Nannocystaceae bacterium]|nr:hypothetical protein [Nannocystaceae bacterium]